MVHEYLKVGKINNKDTWQCSSMNKTGLAVWNNGTPVLESGKINNKGTWQCSNINKAGFRLWNNGSSVLESVSTDVKRAPNLMVDLVETTHTLLWRSKVRGVFKAPRLSTILMFMLFHTWERGRLKNSGFAPKSQKIKEISFFLRGWKKLGKLSLAYWKNIEFRHDYKVDTVRHLYGGGFWP